MVVTVALNQNDWDDFNSVRSDLTFMEGRHRVCTNAAAFRSMVAFWRAHHVTRMDGTRILVEEK